MPDAQAADQLTFRVQATHYFRTEKRACRLDRLRQGTNIEPVIPSHQKSRSLAVSRARRLECVFTSLRAFTCARVSGEEHDPRAIASTQFRIGGCTVRSLLFQPMLPARPVPWRYIGLKVALDAFYIACQQLPHAPRVG